MNPLLLLRPKPRRPNIIPPQLNTKDLLHRPENLLVWHRRSPLKIRHHALRRVALRSQVLLRHLRLHLLSLLGDHGADFLPDGRWLNDVIAAVDLC
jgi:hypothetical protein